VLYSTEVKTRHPSAADDACRPGRSACDEAPGPQFRLPG
jgi:hypothetical protein